MSQTVFGLSPVEANLKFTQLFPALGGQHSWRKGDAVVKRFVHLLFFLGDRFMQQMLMYF